MSLRPRTLSTSAIAAVAAGLFAAAVLVGPRFLMSGIDAGGSDGAYAADVDLSSVELAASTPLAFAGGPVPTTTTSTTTTIPVTTVPVVPGGTTLGGGTHGEITVTVAPLDSAPYRHDDEVRWRITVRNSGTEYLWGVYAYLEGFGRVGCSDRRLSPGQTSECIARIRMDPGDYTADAWATAWTETDEIRDGDVYLTHVAEM